MLASSNRQSAESSPEQWYLVATKPRQEQRAQEHLTNQSIQSLLPLVDVEKTQRGKRVVRTEALFPGYIFVCLSEHDPKFCKLRSTRGVRDFVRFSGKPAVVPEALMARLQQEFGNQKPQRVICRLPQAGQPVMIIDGPFAGLEAIFNTLDGDERAILLLDILGKQQSISVQLSQLDTNYSKS